MTTEAEFKELKETVAVLIKKVDKMNDLLTDRLIKTVEPLPDEEEATLEYQKDTKNKTITFIPLEELKRK
jgi:hypothetical protein